MNTFVSVQCSKTGVQVRAMFNKMVLDPSLLIFKNFVYISSCLFAKKSKEMYNCQTHFDFTNNGSEKASFQRCSLLFLQLLILDMLYLYKVWYMIR